MVDWVTVLKLAVVVWIAFVFGYVAGWVAGEGCRRWRGWQAGGGVGERGDGLVVVPSAVAAHPLAAGAAALACASAVASGARRVSGAVVVWCGWSESVVVGVGGGILVAETK